MTKSDNKKMLVGVWTPWANVLCPACHNEWLTPQTGRVAPVEYEQADVHNNGVTHCDRCGCDIIVRHSVSAEHNLVAWLNTEFDLHAEMWQTGGMCSACVIPNFPLSDNFDDHDDTDFVWVTFEDSLWYVGDGEKIVFETVDTKSLCHFLMHDAGLVNMPISVTGKCTGINCPYVISEEVGCRCDVYGPGSCEYWTE